MKNTIAAVARDEVACPGDCSADRIGSAGDDATTAVAHGVSAGDVGTDHVALDQCGRSISGIDANSDVARDEVTGARCCSAERVTADVDPHASAGIAESLGTGDIRADLVAFDEVIARAIILHSGRPIARNEVACPCRCSANRVATNGIADPQASAQISEGQSTGDVRSDQVAVDEVVAGAVIFQAGTEVPRDQVPAAAAVPPMVLAEPES